MKANNHYRNNNLTHQNMRTTNDTKAAIQNLQNLLGKTVTGTIVLDQENINQNNIVENKNQQIKRNNSLEQKKMTI